MKEFIAFAKEKTANSGIQTYEGALEWARKHFATNPTSDRIFVAKVTNVVERTEPALRTTAFVPEPPAVALGSAAKHIPENDFPMPKVA